MLSDWFDCNLNEEKSVAIAISRWLGYVTYLVGSQIKDTYKDGALIRNYRR